MFSLHVHEIDVAFAAIKRIRCAMTLTFSDTRIGVALRSVPNY